MGTCCDEVGAESAAANYADALDENDPTLASCCARDLRDQRRSQQLKERLSAVDPSTARSKAHAAVISLDPAAHIRLTPSCPQNSNSSNEQSGDDDAELQAIRAHRMVQLHQQLKGTETLRQAGYGTLRDVAASQLLRLAEDVDGCLVCHLAVDGYAPCEQLDEHLTVLASRSLRTSFVRVRTARRSPLCSQLKVEAAPALVCFKDGAVVGRAPLMQLGTTDDILEEEVNAYLSRLHMLSTSRQVQEHKGDDSDGSSSDSADDTGAAPCDVCGRCYPHEHVKAVYRGGVEGDESDDHDDGS